MNIVLIQARLSSIRLPGKVLADVDGQPMLAQIVARCRKSRLSDWVGVVTSIDSSDDPLAKFCEDQVIPVYRGSLNDVLDRFYRAALHFGAHNIVRITGDCPFADARVIDEVLSALLEGHVDYASNVDPPTYPDGLDTEAFTFAALERAWREATLPSDREHVTPYIRREKSLFSFMNVSHGEDLSALRLTVDEPRDLDLIRMVMKAAGDPFIRWEDVVALLHRNPAWSDINAGILRNEGYQRSLLMDVQQKP